MIDLLLVCYGNIDYILHAPFMAGLQLIKKAREREEDKPVWQMWLALYPYMDKKTFVPYPEFKNKMLKKASDVSKRQTPEEMLTMVKVLNAAFGGKVVEI